MERLNKTTMISRLLKTLITTLTSFHGHSLGWKTEIVKSWTIIGADTRGGQRRWNILTKEAMGNMVEL